MREIVLYHAMDLATGVLGQLSDTGPKAIPNVSDKTDTILGWVKWAVMVMIPIMGFVGIVMIPAGKLSGNRMVGNVGFSLLGVTALCAILYAVIIPVFRTLI